MSNRVVYSLQDFREPLYLKDKPVRIEDTRSEEERKYPELFRSKLEGAPVSVYGCTFLDLSLQIALSITLSRGSLC